MKALKQDATHYQQKHNEYWLLEDGKYIIYLTKGIGRELSLILMGWRLYE